MITGILVGLTTVALLIASAHSDRQKRNAIRDIDRSFLEDNHA